MESVGCFEARTHLPPLLGRVSQGEEAAITRHGEPIARLVAAVPAGAKSDVRQVIEELKGFRFRKGNTAREGVTVRDLIEEGRRYGSARASRSSCRRR